MDRLINELTFYSKIDTNRIPYTFDKINVNGLFRGLCGGSWAWIWRRRGIELAYFQLCG